jgi:hypothetical protein
LFHDASGLSGPFIVYTISDGGGMKSLLGSACPSCSKKTLRASISDSGLSLHKRARALYP